MLHKHHFLRKCTKIFVCTFILFATNNFLFAQSKNTALQFTIGNNFTLSSFQGSTISFQKQLSNNNALRFGVSINGEIGKYDVDRTNHQETTVNATRNAAYIYFNAYYLFYNQSQNNLFLFWGLGPTVGFSNDYMKHIDDGLIEENIFRVGICGTIGVELFVKQYLSLLAEYSSALLYQYRKSNYEHSEYGSIEKANIFSFTSYAVKFGLSVHL